jgi:hypothetical protein
MPLLFSCASLPLSYLLIISLSTPVAHGIDSTASNATSITTNATTTFTKCCVLIDTDRKKYASGEIVSIFGGVFDKTGKPLQANVSINAKVQYFDFLMQIADSIGISSKPSSDPVTISEIQMPLKNGFFAYNRLNTDGVGLYTLTVSVNGTDAGWTSSFKTVNTFITKSAYLLYAAVGCFIALMVILVRIHSGEGSLLRSKKEQVNGSTGKDGQENTGLEITGQRETAQKTLEVIHINPIDETVGVEVDSRVTATFSNSIRSSTVNPNTFSVKDANGNPVQGRITLTDNNTTIRFNPVPPFNRNSRYTVTITKGIMDISGASLAADKEWHFTTVGITGQEESDKPVPDLHHKEVYRFILISGIVLLPILSFIWTDVETGTYGPVGIILTNSSAVPNNNQTISQWALNIGGSSATEYRSGIVIPLYIVLLGTLGGYLRYLYKTYQKGEHPGLDNKKKKEKEEEEEKHMTPRKFMRETLGELATIFLAPLLAIAVWLIILEQITSPYALAAISLIIGLAIEEVISGLQGFAKGIAKSVHT